MGPLLDQRALILALLPPLGDGPRSGGGGSRVNAPWRVKFPPSRPEPALGRALRATRGAVLPPEGEESAPMCHHHQMVGISRRHRSSSSTVGGGGPPRRRTRGWRGGPTLIHP